MRVKKTGLRNTLFLKKIKRFPPATEEGAFLYPQNHRSAGGAFLRVVCKASVGGACQILPAARALR